MPYNRGSVWHKSRLKSRDFYRKSGIRTPIIWHTDPPPFMPYAPFLLEVGMVFHCWIAKATFTAISSFTDMMTRSEGQETMPRHPLGDRLHLICEATHGQSMRWCGQSALWGAGSSTDPEPKPPNLCANSQYLTAKQKPAFYPILAKCLPIFDDVCPILAHVWPTLADSSRFLANFSEGNAGILWQN